MEHIYPELTQRRNFILKVTEVEETRFEETLSTGLELVDSIIEKATTKARNKILGKEAFRLYDTYGFPVELTKEIAASHGLLVDLDGFEKEMEKQRERARKVVISEKVDIHEEVIVVKRRDIKSTEFEGYDTLTHKSVIIDLWVNNNSTETINEPQEASLILDATPFYGEMGGQVGDTGQPILFGARMILSFTWDMLPKDSYRLVTR